MSYVKSTLKLAIYLSTLKLKDLRCQKYVRSDAMHTDIARSQSLKAKTTLTLRGQTYATFLNIYVQFDEEIIRIYMIIMLQAF